MTPRLYEKLYGLRLAAPAILLALLTLCVFAVLGSEPANRAISKMAAIIGLLPATETPTPPTQTPPKPTPAPATKTPLPTPTPQPTSAEIPTQPPTEPPTATPDDLRYVCTGVTDGTLYFRDAPSTTGKIIGYLKEGQQVKLIKQADTAYEWYLIEVDGVQGYAYGKFLCKY